MSNPAILALANGDLFRGTAAGALGAATGEVVFNTAVTGYQEILTDPSYARQIVTLTHPHVGNTGINPEDGEAGSVQASGLVIRDMPLLASSWRSKQSLCDYLTESGLVAAADIDTRRLTRVLREQGAQNGCIMAAPGLGEEEIDQAFAAARSFAGIAGMDLVQEVSVARPYTWTEGSWQPGRGFASLVEERFHVVAYDLGAKRNLLRLLVDRGCRLTVVPATTTAEEVLAMSPDGIFLSNGPGDPEPCSYVISSVRTLVEQGLPTFGICLGLQLLALALGAKTVKMQLGHHGANHPVQDTGSGSVLITSQNHGFCVDDASLPACLAVTHRSLFDNTVQGLRHLELPAFGFQGHPEASPGPHDAAFLFDQFTDLMSKATRR